MYLLDNRLEKRIHYMNFNSEGYLSGIHAGKGVAEGFPSKAKSENFTNGKVPEKRRLNNVFELLFGNQIPTLKTEDGTRINAQYSFMKELESFIRDDMGWRSCTVLYRLNYDFLQLCDKYNLDPELKEVVIDSERTLQYTSDYRNYPVKLENM